MDASRRPVAHRCRENYRRQRRVIVLRQEVIRVTVAVRTSPHASGHSRDHRVRRRADAASTTSHRPRSRSRSGL